MNIETIAADGSRVLIVDDQPHIVRMLTSVLADQGYLVQSADEGQSALASFTAWRPELVITDLYLRHIDGLELCRRIRAQSKVPIIVLSDTHEEESKVEALDSGADDYVTKPFASGELLARVRATLRRSGGESGAGSFDAGDFRVDVDARRVHVRRQRSSAHAEGVRAVHLHGAAPQPRPRSSPAARGGVGRRLAGAAAVLARLHGPVAQEARTRTGASTLSHDRTLGGLHVQAAGSPTVKSRTAALHNRHI